MSGRSARHYYTDAELIADARYWRGQQDEWKRRARTEWDGSRCLRHAHACQMRAEASESFLYARGKLDFK